jgi:glycosyltransferase involved in cell wall biosynthesis
MSKPTLLIVSYDFAPAPLLGARRFSFLTREFVRMGYDVHVITNGLRETPHGREDHSLPLAGTIHRCDAPFGFPLKGGGLLARLGNSILRRVLAPVGFEYFWAHAATRKALEVARKLPRGVVIATSPPHAALVAGARIARKLRWPLILDYRDPWSAHDWPEWHRGWFMPWLSARIEATLVKASAARVLNTPDMRNWFEESFSGASSSRNYVVPNGFDAAPRTNSPSATGPIEIVHAGEIYGSRSLLSLLQAVERVNTHHAARPIRVVSYGALPASEWARIREANLEKYIEQRPRIPFAALFAVLQGAHLLLAVLSERMTHSTPHKVYDYMAAGRPILALAPRDAALYELLEDSGAGHCVEAGDVDGIEQVLERALFSGTLPARSRVDRFQWSNLAQDYLQAIDAADGDTPAASAQEPARRVLGPS